MVVGKYCGTTVPGDPLLSTHNTLYFWFYSNAQTNGKGFQVVWQTTDPGEILGFTCSCAFFPITCIHSYLKISNFLDKVWNTFLNQSLSVKCVVVTSPVRHTAICRLLVTLVTTRSILTATGQSKCYLATWCNCYSAPLLWRHTKTALTIFWRFVSLFTCYKCLAIYLSGFYFGCFFEFLLQKILSGPN